MMSPSRSLSMESVKTLNPLPTLIKAKKAISPESAKILMELVDERGKVSEWYSNPKCLEYQIANPFALVRGENDHRIIALLPELFGLGESGMRHINWGFKNSAFECATGYHGFWVLKYFEGGEFEPHCDWDSGPNGIRPPVVATAAILLNEDYEGGELIIYDSEGTPSIIESKREQYSMTIWDGYTQHCVKPVTKGTRYALVIHYTGISK